MSEKPKMARAQLGCLVALALVAGCVGFVITREPSGNAPAESSRCDVASLASDMEFDALQLERLEADVGMTLNAATGASEDGREVPPMLRYAYRDWRASYNRWAACAGLPELE